MQEFEKYKHTSSEGACRRGHTWAYGFAVHATHHTLPLPADRSVLDAVADVRVVLVHVAALLVKPPTCMGCGDLRSDHKGAKCQLVQHLHTSPRHQVQ